MLPKLLSDLYESTAVDVTRVSERRRALLSLAYASQAQLVSCGSAARLFCHANDLRLLDFRILEIIASVHDDSVAVTPGYLCEAVLVAPSTVSSILDRLTERGLIRKGRESQDKRQITLHHTQAGAQMIINYFDLLADSIGSFTGTLDAAELNDRVEVLKDLKRATDHLSYELSRSPELSQVGQLHSLWADD